MRLDVWALVAGSMLMVACGAPDPAEPPEPQLPPPGPFVAGFAEAKMPVPLGIGTMGYGGFVSIHSVSPFAESYPATVRQHAALTFRAAALSRGPDYQVIFVRSDTVGIFQHLREAVLDELEVRTGRDFDHALILGANHTHSGPGRLLQSEGLLNALSDSFFPEFYDRMVLSIADVVEQAIADQKPAQLATATLELSGAHDDRRCENDPLDQIQKRDDLPLIAVRRDGALAGLILSYAFHGTILDITDLTLSPDMGGIAEHKIAEQLDAPVPVMLFNSWGGDSAPGDDGIVSSATGSEQPSGFDRMEGLGREIGLAVTPALDALQFEAEPMIRSVTRRVRIDRDALGYDEDTFPFPSGGVYCGVAAGNCDAQEAKPGIDQSCVPFPTFEPAPMQTLFTAGQLGELYFITGTGEWGTALADGLLQQMSSMAGDRRVAFFGYSNDYTGYSLGETDWWQGGYETGGALWGPRQGDYLAARGVEVFRSYLDPSYSLPFAEPAPMPPFAGYTYSPYVPEQGLKVGTVEKDVPATAGANDVVEFTVLGGDPWLGTPVAILEAPSGGGFAPVTRGNQTQVNSDGYELWVELAVEPAYADAIRAEQRTFRWTFRYPVTHRVPTKVNELTGDVRFRVLIPKDASGAVVEATTGVVSIDR